MLLAIDIGNTNTVFALYNEDVLVQSWRCQTDSARSADEYASFLNQLFPQVNIEWLDISDVIVSSVVPEANFHISDFSQKYLKVEAHILSVDTIDVRVDLPNPDEVGADRLVNAKAVMNEHAFPAIVIDFGTATTFDVISVDGAYAGGVIAPGIRLSMRALHEATAKLPDVSIKRPDHALGKSTAEAMRSGVYWGYRGLIEGIVRELKAEMGVDEKIHVIATGGLAPFFAQDMDVIEVVDQDLTLKGLRAIHHEIKDKSVV